eukprot:6489338-Amphidinium_carterae.2
MMEDDSLVNSPVRSSIMRSGSVSMMPLTKVELSEEEEEGDASDSDPPMDEQTTEADRAAASQEQETCGP